MGVINQVKREAAFEAMGSELENDKADLLPRMASVGTSSSLSKIYIISEGARQSLAEIPDRSQKIVDAFVLKLYPEIVRS